MPQANEWGDKPVQSARPVANEWGDAPVSAPSTQQPHGFWSDFKSAVLPQTILGKMGGTDIAQGVDTMRQPGLDPKFEGAHQILTGASKMAAPFALPYALAEPAAALTTLGAGMLGQKVGSTAAQAFGAPPGASDLIGDAAGLATGGLANKLTPSTSTIRRFMDAKSDPRLKKSLIDFIPYYGSKINKASNVLDMISGETPFEPFKPSPDIARKIRFTPSAPESRPSFERRGTGWTPPEGPLTPQPEEDPAFQPFKVNPAIKKKMAFTPGESGSSPSYNVRRPSVRPSERFSIQPPDEVSAGAASAPSGGPPEGVKKDIWNKLSPEHQAKLRESLGVSSASPVNTSAVPLNVPPPPGVEPSLPGGRDYTAYRGKYEIDPEDFAAARRGKKSLDWAEYLSGKGIGEKDLGKLNWAEHAKQSGLHVPNSQATINQIRVLMRDKGATLPPPPQ